MDILDSHSLHKNGHVNNLSVDKLKQWIKAEIVEVDPRKIRKTIP